MERTHVGLPQELGPLGVPKAIYELLRTRNLEQLGIRLAIAFGLRDANQLTNLVFFARHPARGHRKLRRSEPNFSTLSREWRTIRDSLVRPMLQTSGNVTSTNQRPPGLPHWARHKEGKYSALYDVKSVAKSYKLGPSFVRAVAQMALTESAATYGRPAYRFDARPPEHRPPGRRLITAWGVFQFNRDAWTSLFTPDERRKHRSFIANQPARGCGSSKGCVFPWDSSRQTEIGRPIARYAQIFREVMAFSGAEQQAVQALRLYHIGSTRYRRWRKRAREHGVAHAWSHVPARIFRRCQAFAARARENPRAQP